MTNAGKLKIDTNNACIIDIAAGLVLAAMALAALFWLIPDYVELGTSKNDVGPAFFPQLTAGAVLGLSLILIFVRAIHYKKGNPGLPGLSIIIEIVIWTVISILAVLGISRLGFVFTSSVLVGFGAIACGYRKWWAIALLAVLFPLIIDQAAWLVFTVDLP